MFIDENGPVNQHKLAYSCFKMAAATPQNYHDGYNTTHPCYVDKLFCYLPLFVSMRNHLTGLLMDLGNNITINQHING